MANNRLYLGCADCFAEGLADSIIQIAKYYPSTGWYPWGGNLEEWMDRHSHHRSTEGYDDQKKPPFNLYYEDSIPAEIWEARFAAYKHDEFPSEVDA
jgi:hypothetical protein